MNIARALISAAALAFVLVLSAGCSSTVGSPAEQQKLADSSHSALDTFQREDPTLQKFLNNAYGYAIFPSVGEGAFIFGAADGRGVLYEQGKPVGLCRLEKGTFGLQAGGQSFSEIIVFQNQNALNSFQSGSFAFDAGVSAVALNSGAAAAAPYRNGVAVFIRSNGGLMASAAVGGQKFNYTPMEYTWNTHTMSNTGEPTTRP